MHRYSGLFQTVRIKHIPAMWLVIVIACAFCFQCSETACRADGIGEEPALSQTVDLSMTGRRISLQSLLEALEGDPVNGVGWGVECIIDHKALRQQGVHYDEILINDFELKGISRASALRFILHRSGLGFYQVGDRVVITTREIAKTGNSLATTLDDVSGLQTATLSEQKRAVFLAGYTTPSSQDWIRFLQKALLNSDRQMSFDASFAIAGIAPTDSKVRVTLCQLIRSDDPTIREAAAYAMARIGSPAIDDLLSMLDSDDQIIASTAARAFCSMGSVAAASTDRLIAAGERWSQNPAAFDESGDSRICREIASAVATVELGTAVGRLTQGIESSNDKCRGFAALAIAEIGPPDHGHIPNLQVLLKDASVFVRRNAAYAMAKLDLPVETETLSLEVCAQDNDMYVRLWASEALRIIKSKRKP